MPVYVQGLREISGAYAKLDRDLRRGFRAELRDVAEPVRRDAEMLAVARISRIGGRWSKMRVGITGQVVYVAPRERGRMGRGDDPRRRPRFADLLLGRAMEPALERNETEVERRVEQVLDHLIADFNR